MAVDERTGIEFVRPRPLGRMAKVESGVLKGVPGNNPAVTVFKGVPYAQPPIGPLRWKKPRTVKAWEGIRMADTFGPVAPQETFPADLMYGKEFFQSIDVYSEDCLYLNIWTPCIHLAHDMEELMCRDGNGALDTLASYEEGLPVMFWIHGGGLSGGNGHEPEFDGEEFCRNGVILVTINYRLNIFGFLAHPELSAEEGEEHVSGNYGHYDQLTALQWVYRNIRAFGGNPENITVFGQSAGAGSVQTLVASKLTDGLISKAIIQSGVSISGQKPDSFRCRTLEDGEKEGLEIMDLAGCTSIQQLREKSYEELMQLPGMGFGGKYHFGTIIDGRLTEKSAEDAFMKNDYKDIPFMVGNTAGEGVLFACDEEAAALEGEIHAMEVGNRVFASLQDRVRNKPIYLYRFDRNLPGTDPKDPRPFILKGSFHSSELWYVFKTLQRCWRPMCGVDYDLATVMNKYWCNFAKCGNPNGKGLPQWRCFTQADPAYMHLGDVQECRNDPVPPARQKKIDEYLSQ